MPRRDEEKSSKQPKHVHLKNDVDGRASRARSESLRLENQTKIFASMCPDEILDHYDDFKTRGYQTTLMLCDISGFTEMTDKYTKLVRGGPSRLTETLNAYMGSMVQEILFHGGDVLKFSGDALIVMWKLEDGQVMRDCASEAIRTACVIQKHFGTYETEIGIVLKVKLAIASGKTYFTSIGSLDSSTYYIITGTPVWEAKNAESLCRGGDILVSPSTWQWINENEYIYEILPEGPHYLIISLSAMWDNTKEIETKEQVSSSSSSSQGSVFSDDRSELDKFHRELYFSNQITNDSVDYSLRPKVVKMVKMKRANDLRSYILRPVKKSVYEDEPLEYLTEIRQVVIVFVNVVTVATNRKTLIKLVDATYQFVCSVVTEMQGCVNKTSLFDKDLIFLCIFGLRGDKHELECQIGLRCASLLRRGLLQFALLKSVSIAVTTGMGYCGVVGHVLRREYTVIGMAVNKAARLMCAYVDKVVCDRDCFLLSHLEAKHFVLQEPKYLKGITNVGSIYEFNELSSSSQTFQLNHYPILGRDKELRIFRENLEHMLKKSNSDNIDKDRNILLLRGTPRIGKTRLLEEMNHMVPDNIITNFISMEPYDFKMFYVLIRLLFFAPLKIKEDTKMQVRKRKIASKFLKEDHSRLHFLNQIFDVDFSPSNDYLDQVKSKSESEVEKERKNEIKRLMRLLTLKCFHKPSVVFIDDAELSDEESISLLQMISNQRNLFIVMAYGNKLTKQYFMHHKLPRMAKILELSGLDKWYHASLACQLLNVVAISVMLERVIQERSEGNPGWIESYLITLLQSSAIQIEIMTNRQIHQFGLVKPTENMLQRTQDAGKWASHSYCEAPHGWEMYQTSFRDSIYEDKDQDLELDDPEERPVCTITSFFKAEFEFIESSMDILLIKLYDSLTPLDQVLLKCAAVLGEVVDRKMLEELMVGISNRDLGLSLLKLFELRIIGCAYGEFHQTPTKSILFHHHRDSEDSLDTTNCCCKGIVILDELADLPKHASCGLMRFKLDLFRKTTYRLLTETQKVEFHSKALTYLRHNTRRCEPCGGGQFKRLLGETALDRLKRRKKAPIHLNITADLKVSVNFDEYNDPIQETVESEESSSGDESIESNTSSRSYFSKPLAKSQMCNFINADFQRCTCHLILLTAYTHVLEHCRGIGISELLLVSILEFVEICMWTRNVPKATKLLNEADELMKSVHPPVSDELLILPYLKGKISNLRGKCFFESGMIYESMECFHTTLEVMGYKFPTSPFVVRIKSMCMLEQLKLMLTSSRSHKIGILRDDAANYNDQFAYCLAHMFKFFKLNGMGERAKLASTWALIAALESSQDFFILCTSYANMMSTAYEYHYESIGMLLEINAINLCWQRQDNLERQELTAIVELYRNISFLRLLRGDVVGAANIGFTVGKLAHAVKSSRLKLLILPGLIQMSLAYEKYSQAASLINDLNAIPTDDLSKQIWYYALCMDFLLDSGMSLVRSQEFNDFYLRESRQILHLEKSEAANRFFTSTWLWYIRIGDWDSAALWISRRENKSFGEECKILNTLTSLKQLEGLIISYVHYLNENIEEDSHFILNMIKKQFKLFNKRRNIAKIMLPRFYLMKAYYGMVRRNPKSAVQQLAKSKKLAVHYKAELIFNWACHSEKAWTNLLSKRQRDYWIDESTKQEKIDWQDVDKIDRKFIHFTLPLPKILDKTDN
ncbi:hypothetical protein TKK_0014741 [Trichogramma kaykai]